MAAFKTARAFFLGAMASASPLFAAPQASFETVSVRVPFDLTAVQVAPLYSGAKETLDARLDAIAAVPASERTFANTVAALEAADAEFREAVEPAFFVGAGSRDPALRAAVMDQYLPVIEGREDVYRAVEQYAERGEKVEGADKRLLEDTLRRFRLNGMGLEPGPRRRLHAISAELASLANAYRAGMRDPVELNVSPAELDGMPSSFAAGLPRAADGSIRIPITYDNHDAIMLNARDEGLRRRAYGALWGRAPGNVGRLESALSLRHEMSRDLGQPSSARLAMEGREIESPWVIAHFLKSVRDLLRPAVAAQFAQLLALKKEEDPGAVRLEPWDLTRYEALFKERAWGLRQDEIKQYFPAERVVSGTLAVFSDIFGVDFVETPSEDAAMRHFEVRDPASGNVLAEFYLDEHAQSGGAMALVKGRRLDDGRTRRPVSVLSANFPQPEEGLPSLLAHANVRVFFHEFGHLMHQLLTRSEYARFSGAFNAVDFMETFSQLMEKLIWRPDVLARISGHYSDPSRPLPPELLAKMDAARLRDLPFKMLMQAAWAGLDLALHALAPPVDSTAVARKVFKMFGLLPPVDGVAYQSMFSHLMGFYWGGYYTYLTTLAHAEDLSSRDLLAPGVGADLRRIMEPGGGIEPRRLMRGFLGRDVDDRALWRALSKAVPQ